MTVPLPVGRVVLVGGTGLIGRALTKALAGHGVEVVVLTRRAPAELRLPVGCRAVRWDGRSSLGWLDAADGASAIVNLAGEPIAGGRWSATRKRRIVDSRLAATAAVVEAIERSKHRPATLLQASAVGFYGDRGDEPLDESSAAGDGFLARTAIAWERASAPVEGFGVRRVLLRTGIVLAREGGALPAMLWPFRLGLGGRLGSGAQWMPWIHLADEVGALLHLLADERASGAVNLCAPAPVTNAELTRTLARQLRRPGFLAAPAFVLRAALGEMAILVLGGQRAVPRRLLDLGFAFRHPDLEGALGELLASGGGGR